MALAARGINNMISMKEMEIMLDDLATEFPRDFYQKLNGGILLLPEIKWNTEIKGRGLCILGQYHKGGNMGSYISIYYGSFMRVFGHLDKEQMKERLRSTLRHEFTHHMESLAGESGLEKKDAKFISDYLRRHKKQ